MDNLGSHRGKAERHAIRQAGAKLFFAEIFAGPEPNRAGLLQAQAWAQKSRGPLLRCRPLGNRQTSSLLLPKGMRQLRQKLRVWSRLNSTRSNAAFSEKAKKDLAYDLLCKWGFSLKPGCLLDSPT